MLQLNFARVLKRIMEINVLNNGSKVSMSFSQFADGLWKEYSKRVKPSTAHTYASTLKNHLLPKLVDKMLHQIIPADITDRLKESAKTLTTGKSLKNVYGLMQVMFDVALEYDLINSSPVRPKLHRPPATTKTKVALSAEQISRVIEAAKAEHRPALICIALTGLRIGEFMALRWMDLDFKNSRINVTHTLWQNRLYEPKTAASKRSIHMPDVLMNVLKMHYEQSRWREPTDYVFSRRDGSPMSYTYLRKRILCPALDAIGIQREKSLHGFHLFRHSAATILDEETKSLRAARDLLGHSQEMKAPDGSGSWPTLQGLVCPG